ncbi:MAG: response regulator [Deltaproteobacteria bacterium]|nr:response regulator [Deltaproteobacteria bacterium]
MGNLLQGKQILIVDDEPDVLDTLEQLLSMCRTTRAATFEEAAGLLEDRDFDVAVLDIMGVDGYKLLEIAGRKNTIAVMLTAHALSPGNIMKSFQGGAASYLPKEELGEIAAYLEEVLEAKAKGGRFWSRWLERWSSYYDEKFGPNWKDQDKEFWEKFKCWL